MGRIFGSRALAAIAALACAAALAPSSVVLAAPATLECADYMTVEEVQQALDDNGTDPTTGEQIPVAADGLTVVKGTTPQPFVARLLDVDYGGAGIDHDLIFAELEGLGIDEDRGVWYGMSGSPVYVGDKLVGAVAYGFSAGPSNLAGITPAEEMMQITSGGGASATSTQASVMLTDSQRQSYAAQMSTSSVPGRVPRLKVPLALNVSGERLAWLQREAVEDGSRLTPVAGGGFSASASAAPDISAGSNFAAALSYGDITAAGTGTTTWTCDGEALAFGHPFAWSGKTTLSLHNARAVTVVRDQTFGSYKLATLGAPVGTVDQDRYTGIRGLVGTLPHAAPVRTFTTAEHPDGSLSFDEGRTDVVGSENVPFFTFIQGFTNIDFLLDRYLSPGSSVMAWTVDVTHNGQTYRLERQNRFNSTEDISIESMVEPYSQLEQLANSGFGPVQFDRVDVESRSTDTQRYYRLAALQTRRDGAWVNRTRTLTVNPGQSFRVRAVLHRFEGSQQIATRNEVFTLTVPRRARGSSGMLSIGRAGGSGGEEEDVCFIEGECDSIGSADASFSALVRRLDRAPRNDEMLSRLSLSGPGGFRWNMTEKRLLPQVVNGTRYFGVRVRQG